jgi:hypothetical protein
MNIHPKLDIVEYFTKRKHELRNAIFDLLEDIPNLYTQLGYWGKPDNHKLYHFQRDISNDFYLITKAYNEIVKYQKDCEDITLEIYGIIRSFIKDTTSIKMSYHREEYKIEHEGIRYSVKKHKDYNYIRTYVYRSSSPLRDNRLGLTIFRDLLQELIKDESNWTTHKKLEFPVAED